MSRTRSFDPDQIRFVADDLLKTIADHLDSAEEGLRTTRPLWEPPFAGLDVYESTADAWAEVCLAFGTVLKESSDRLSDTCGHLRWAADRYAEAEASGGQLVVDVFDVYEVVPE